MGDIEKLIETVENYEQDMVRMLCDLIEIPALGPKNGGAGEYQKAEYIMRKLQELGFEKIKRYDIEDKDVPSGIRPNIEVTIPGRSENSLWIVTHMDIVPAGDLNKWKTDPFKGVVKNGKVYGRGSEDNGQSLVASIYAAKALLDIDITPNYTLKLLISADEETGSEKGVKALLNRDIFKEKDVFLVPDGGNEHGTLIEVAEKSILWLKVVTTGKQSHGSMPNKGKNAFKAGMKFAMRLDDFLYTKYDKEDSLFSPSISTFEPTKKEANVPNVNTIPGEDIFYMDCRILPDYDSNEVYDSIVTLSKEIEKECGVNIEVSKVMHDAAAPPTSPDSEIVKKLSQSIKKIRSVEPYTGGIGGGTYAAMFRRAGYDAVVWSTVHETAHAPNEYTVIKNMVDDSKVMALLSIL